MAGVEDIAHRLGRDVRTEATQMLVPTLLALAGGMLGTAAAAFLIAWAYLTLSAALGQGAAALLVGLGLAILAGGLLALARNRLSSKTPPEPAPAQAQPAAPGAVDLASEVAFTAAFVLARYMGADKRD
jgi:predicted lipid-binding transport protein (Tim44 family)